MKKILILGSAPDAIRVSNFDKEFFNSIVAINNAWRINPNWSHSIFPTDFPVHKRPLEKLNQTLHTADEYVPIQNNYGGFLYAGGTMAFTAAYWALGCLEPDLIAFLGCDMVYEGTNTHFYGSGTADPLRKDPSLRSIEAKANRFEYFANKMSCKVVNISEKGKSRLTFQKVEISQLDCCDFLPRKFNSTLISEALSMEEKLDYFVESGKYWKETDKFDISKIDELDLLWLNSFGN